MHGINEFYSIALPPILPLLLSDLDITYTRAGLLLSVFFLMYSIFQLPAGILSDRIGKTRLLVVGMVGMAAGVGLAAMAESYEMLVASQIVAGISGSTYHPAGMALVSDIETIDTEGTAMGLFGFGGMVGVAGAPVVVGGVGSYFHWRVGLAAAVLVGLAGTVLFHAFFEVPAPEKRAPLEVTDWRSRGTDGLGTLIHSRLRAVRAGTNAETVRRAYRRTILAPLSTGIGVLLLVTMFFSTQSRAIQTFTTSYVTLFDGGTAWLANAAFLALLVGGSISSLWAGVLADRWSREKLGGITSVITAGLLATLAFLMDVIVTAPDVVVAVALIGWFFVLGNLMYACVPIKNALVSERAERTFSGSTFGLVQTASALGSTIGPALFGYLATHVSLSVAYPSIAAVSLSLGVIFFALVALEPPTSGEETRPTDASEH